MGAFIKVIPTIVDSWNTLSKVVQATTTNLGMKRLSQDEKRGWQAAQNPICVDVDLEHKTLLSEAMADSENLVFEKKGVMVVFGRTGNGQLRVQAFSSTVATAKLKEIGTKLAQKVLQRYVYEKLKTELQSQEFQFVQETKDEDGTIHLSVRRWK